MELIKTKIFFVDKKAVVDIRDYQRTLAIKLGEDIIIKLTKDEKEIGKMRLKLEQLKDEKLILRRERVPSKIYPGQTYELLSYKWKQAPLTAKDRKAKKDAEKRAKYEAMSEEERFKSGYNN